MLSTEAYAARQVNGVGPSIQDRINNLLGQAEAIASTLASFSPDGLKGSLASAMDGNTPHAPDRPEVGAVQGLEILATQLADIHERTLHLRQQVGRI